MCTCQTPSQFREQITRLPIAPPLASLRPLRHGFPIISLDNLKTAKRATTPTVLLRSGRFAASLAWPSYLNPGSPAPVWRKLRAVARVHSEKPPDVARAV